MNTNATALANYFIDLAKKDNLELKQFGLMKRVYIAHGFSLAILNRSALDPRFDVVEAWKNGPVIPSIYHSFKYNGNNPIKDKSVIVEVKGRSFEMTTPELNDEDIKKISVAVFEKYRGYDDFKLIELLHREGTPWALCYREGENNKIPDLYTKAYYKKVLGI
jgi:uncharacterized phage-associated protein